MGLGTTEIILIFLVVLLFFGAKRLPEVARSMGKAVNEFKKAKDEMLTTPAPQTAPETPAKVVTTESVAATDPSTEAASGSEPAQKA